MIEARFVPNAIGVFGAISRMVYGLKQPSGLSVFGIDAL